MRVEGSGLSVESVGSVRDSRFHSFHFRFHVFGVWSLGLGFGICGLRFWGFGFGVLSLGFRFQVWGKGAEILGLWVWALEVWGFRSRFWVLRPVAWCLGTGVGELGLGF